MRKQVQVVENIREENGLVTIELRTEIAENNGFRKQVEDLAKRLNLERYVTANYQKTETDAKSDKSETVQEFIEKMQPFCVGEPQANDQETILFLKPEVIKNYEKFSEIREEARKLGATLLAYPRPSFSFPNNLSKAEKVIDSAAVTAFIVDLAALHADRLRDFLHKDISKADVAESIKYLIDQGWSEEKLCKLGFSHASLYRLKKYQSDTETQS
jgi:hypothetical protein